jgi:hypothetical protein
VQRRRVLPNVPTPRSALRNNILTDQRIDTALRAGHAIAPFRGVILSAVNGVGFRDRVRAALATQDEDAAASHYTSAALVCLPWAPEHWSADDATVHITVDRDDHHGQRPGLRLHWAKLDERDVMTVDGIRCTKPARTLVDLARDANAQRLLVVQLIDGALRFDRCTTEQLHAALDAAARLRNVRQARAWVALSRLGVDSPKETETRLILQGAGIDVEPNIRIEDEHDGLLLARGDLGDRNRLIWGEYDGYEPHIKRHVFRGDRQGDRWLDQRGWNVLRIVDTDLINPRKLIFDWRAAVRDAPARIAALDPRRSPEIRAARIALSFDRP